jgi:hypothetical protein
MRLVFFAMIAVVVAGCGRTVSWKTTRKSAFILFTRLRGWDVSHYGCAVLTTKPSAYSGPA